MPDALLAKVKAVARMMRCLDVHSCRSQFSAIFLCLQCSKNNHVAFVVKPNFETILMLAFWWGQDASLLFDWGVGERMEDGLYPAVLFTYLQIHTFKNRRNLMTANLSTGFVSVWATYRAVYSESDSQPILPLIKLISQYLHISYLQSTAVIRFHRVFFFLTS